VRVGVAVDLGTVVAVGERLPAQEALMVIVAGFTGMRTGYLRLQPAGLGVGGGVYEVDARFGAVHEERPLLFANRRGEQARHSDFRQYKGRRQPVSRRRSARSRPHSLRLRARARRQGRGRQRARGLYDSH
jgi:hypothetical protein